MRFILATLLTGFLSFIMGMYAPWWSIAVVAFVVALIIKQPIGLAYLSAFLAILFLWGGLASMIQLRNKGVLAQKIANLFPLHGNTFLLIGLTALTGAMVAGFAAMSGSSLRPLDKRYTENRYGK